MLVRSVTRLAAQALLFQPALLFQLDASVDSSIPSDLSASFDGPDLTLQVAYTGDPSDGFASGTEFSQDETTKAPNYALGDASGISSVNKYVIAMYDTSCDSARTLHFLQADFLWSGTETDIASNSKPLVPYQAPGSFKETGKRQYTYLMYNQPSNLKTSGIPSTGSIIVVADFQKALGLDAAVAGIGMVVDLGGNLSCDQPASPSTPPSNPSPPPAPPAAPSVVSPNPQSATPPPAPSAAPPAAPPSPDSAAPAPPAASAPAPGANPPAAPPMGANVSGPAAPAASSSGINPTVALPNSTASAPLAISTGGAGSLRALMDGALVASVLGFGFAAAVPFL